MARSTQLLFTGLLVSAAALMATSPAHAALQPLDDAGMSVVHGQFGDVLLGSLLSRTRPAERRAADNGTLDIARFAMERSQHIDRIEVRLGDWANKQNALALPIAALVLPFIGLPLLPLLSALMPPLPQAPAKKP